MDQGDQILRVCYERIAAAVAALAETDPVLQRHLASIPDRIELSHSTDNGMLTVALRADGSDIPPAIFEKSASTLLVVPAQHLLQSQTLDELTASIASGVAQLVCSHHAEEISLFSLLAAPAVVSAGFWFSGVSFVSCLAMFALLQC